MKKTVFLLLAIFASVCTWGQTYDTQYRRPLSDVMKDVAKRFGVKFRFDMDTTGLSLPYADFRIRPYSLEQTLTNICRYYDWNWWPRSGKLYRISRYEYYRRHTDEGRDMLAYLSSLYSNKEEWEQRRQVLLREVRERLGIDAFLDSCVSNAKPILSKVRKHDGYTTQNICLELTPGQHVFGTIYAPQIPTPQTQKPTPNPSRGEGSLYTSAATKPTPNPSRGEGSLYTSAATKVSSNSNQAPLPSGGAGGGFLGVGGGFPLLICPDGHWPSRYRDDEQQRLGCLARMGAICVDFDLYGYGQSKAEVGEHATARAHVFQAACGLKLLDYMLRSRTDIDTLRIGVCGGSGGGTHTILLSLLAETQTGGHYPRIAAIAPVVHVASHFDGGCPCESSMPVQLAGGGTCEPELAATFAPRPMLVVSDGGDWTASVPELEYPFLQRLYGFYDAEQQVVNVHLPDERHDFGPQKRQAVYDFFARVFCLDRSRADESKITIQSEESLQTILP